MRGSKDTPLAQLERFLLLHIVPVLCIQHTIRERLSTAYTEQIASQPRSIAVDVVQRWTLSRRDTSAHRAHTETHALVRINQIGKDLTSSSNGDARLLPQLMQPTLHAQVSKPVLTIRRSSRHRAQQTRVDLNDLLDRLTGDPIPRRCSGVCGYDDTALEAECEGGCAVGDFDGARGVGVVVCHASEP